MRQTARTALAALLLGLGLIWAGTPLPAVASVEAAQAASPSSQAVIQVAGWVLASGDNGGLPFAIVDKSGAEVFVFGADGQLLGAAPALLGFARGDDSAPGIGERPMSAITPEERTTPAGRFLGGYGHASGDRKVVLWVDYETAISLHPVVTANRKEHRLKRLRSSSREDNRITYGCINVSAAFYEEVVRKTFTGTRGVFYILPEAKPVDEVFPALEAYARASTVPAGGPEQEARVSEAAGAPGSDAASVR